MTKTTAIELYETLLDEELFTDEELRLLTNINGLSIETLNDAIYARYGYRDYEQMKESEEEWRKKKRSNLWLKRQHWKLMNLLKD